MVVSNSESSIEVMTVLSKLCISVSVTVSTAKSASMSSTSMADIGITLVIPVVMVVVVGVWVMVSVWSPGEVICAIDLSEMVIESLNVTWLVVSVTPDSIVLVVTIVLSWSKKSTDSLGGSASKAKSNSKSFH